MYFCFWPEFVCCCAVVVVVSTGSWRIVEVKEFVVDLCNECCCCRFVEVLDVVVVVVDVVVVVVVSGSLDGFWLYGFGCSCCF